MKRPTFLEGVGVALAASLAGGALYTALGTLVPPGDLLRLLIAGLGLAYVLYLLNRSGERVGRVTTLAAWCLAAVLTLLLPLSLTLYALAHLGLVWLIRSLYYYSSLFPALADLALSGLSLAAAVWAAVQTGSVFLSLWSLFLVQALFVTIPPSLRRGPAHASSPREDDRFEHAHRSAEAAVRKLSSVR